MPSTKRLLAAVAISTVAFAAPTIDASGAPAAAGDVGCSGELATIVGTPGDDTLVGTDGDDVVWLDSGADVFHGLGGNDHVCGGPGADQLFGEEGNDHLEDAGTNEVIIVVERGQAAGQLAESDAADDMVDGGPGNDFVLLSLGDDSAIAGDGDDALWLVGQETVTVDANTGVSEGQGSDTFSGFESYLLHGTFIGSARAETVFASGVADLTLGGGADFASVFATDAVVRGGPGDDDLRADRGHVYGGSGNDRIDVRYLATIHAGAGNDHVFAPKPRDHELVGGSGTDSVSLRVHHPMVIDLSKHIVRYPRAGATASVRGFEVVVAGEGDDVVRGSGRTERLQGYSGNDRLLGGGGADQLIGGEGEEDRADGGADRDRCRAEQTRRCEE